MADKHYSTRLQDFLERHIFILLLFVAIVVSIGGIVEIVPLYVIEETLEDQARNPDGTLKHPELRWERNGQALSDWQAGDGIRPYTPLELVGRTIYKREGCYLCHSQMIRPFRDEKERYGHYSLAAESQYDHPFQWGSKRTGPDLARVGAKYSDAWHVAHLLRPQAVVPESVMPAYPWLANAPLDLDHTLRLMKAMQRVGVPYEQQDFDAVAQYISGRTEMDAMVAYLQVLGTMVAFEPGKDYRE